MSSACACFSPQGVPLSKRFALVPLGPPLLNYSSTCKAMLQYDAVSAQPFWPPGLICCPLP